MFSSKAVCEEFLLRSLNASPLMKPFVTPGWVARIKIRVLKGLCRFEIFSQIKYSGFFENMSSLYTTASKKIVSDLIVG